MNINHVCLLCLGSNKEGNFHLEKAQQTFKRLFVNVQIGNIVVTRAEGNVKQADYLNQAVRFETGLSREEVEALLKQIEKDNGRTSEDKGKGSVPLDIDLLMFDTELLRPDDVSKSYVQCALHALSLKSVL